MKRVYLAGPMSGIPEFNFPAFHAMASALRGAGFDVVNPAEINGPAAVDAGMTWADCMRADIAQLVTCDGIALLPGWENSRGATLEHHIAKALGMHVAMAAHLITAPAAAGAVAEAVL